MMTPLSAGEIKRIWSGQNPSLVQHMTTAGTLTARLKEAANTASLVQGDAIERGMSPQQARELAVDAVGLPAADD